jgi:molybdopterin molybdotransferase
MSGAGDGNRGMAADPRLKGFKTRTSVAEIAGWISSQIGPLESEDVPLGEAAGRVLARDVVARFPVPTFNRAAMDGFAVHGEETFGASVYTPADFRSVGRSRPGLACGLIVSPGEAVQVATGAPLPAGADAVVPFESTRTEGESVFVHEAVPQGRNVSWAGEDIVPGAAVLREGRVLRPQDLGVLSALGAARVRVVGRPRVAVLVTGDELLAAGSEPCGFQIPDMNSVMIAALADRDGGNCEVAGPIADVRTKIASAIAELAARADVLLVTGGSSAGPEDHVPGIIAEMGRLIAHGLALRPASPTGLGVIGDGELPVVLLPGSPVSCLCAYDFVAGPIIRRLAGRPQAWPYRRESLPLARKLTSVVGRVDYARVRFCAGQVEPIATSGASILSSVSRADGFVVIPADREGYPAGTEVQVWCYDEQDPRTGATHIEPPHTSD